MRWIVVVERKRGHGISSLAVDCREAEPVGPAVLDKSTQCGIAGGLGFGKSRACAMNAGASARTAVVRAIFIVQPSYLMFMDKMNG